MSTAQAGCIQILNVDDEQAFRDLTETYLEREDDQFTVESAPSADEALERISNDPPDCVISDYNMPTMDGLELLESVREEYPDLPFILYTGKGSEAVAGKAISAGVTDYLQKQSGKDQYELLANRIQNAVTARRNARQAARQKELMRLTEFAGETGGFEIDTTSGEILYTTGACRILDVAQNDDHTLEDWLQQFRPSDRDEVSTAIDRALSTNQQTRGTWHYRRSDDDERLLELIFTPVDAEESPTTLRGAIHDDTERRRQERRYQALVEESGDIISVLDTDGIYQYLSPTVERILGYDPQEPVGDSAWEYIHPDDRGRVMESFQSWVSDPEGSNTIEYRARHADGSWRWIEARGNAQTENPAIDGYIVNSRDITDRKQREQDLTEARELMANMETLADAGAWEYDADSDTLSDTGGAARLFGLDTETELTLRDAFEYVHPADRDRLEDCFYNCLENGDPYEIDLRINTEEGKRRWLTAQGERIEHDGSGAKVRGYIRDVTAQKNREQELRDLQSQYQTLVENFPDGAVFLYNQDTEFVRVGGSELRALGFSRDDFEGNTPHDLFSTDIADEVVDVYQTALEGKSSSLEETYAGERYRVRVAPVRTSDRNIQHGIAVSQNITEQTEHRRALERKNERLDEFASIVSHDLKSPLRVARGQLELAVEQADSDHVTKALDAIERGQNLIDDLLLLAREGDGIDSVDPVSLASVAERSWQNTDTEQATVDIDANTTIQADRSRLKQLFENLFKNAVDHTGSAVTVTVGEMADGFYVADTGPGVPESDREEIFEARYSTKDAGTGFGLRIVDQVATAHGWEVTVTESEAGGARFEVTGVSSSDGE
jgi:PAS domain S-box-containing protein